MVQNRTHIKRWFSETLNSPTIKLTFTRLTTHLPTERRKISFFAFANFKKILIFIAHCLAHTDKTTIHCKAKSYKPTQERVLYQLIYFNM